MGEPWQIGQTVLLSWYGGQTTPAKISKIGRKWITVTREFPYGGTEDGRFDKDTMEAHDDDRFKRAWKSAEDMAAHTEQERIATLRRDLWQKVRDVFYHEPPADVTTEAIEQWLESKARTSS